MRYQSKKQRDLYDSARQSRRNYLLCHPVCAVCRETWASEVHEVTNGPSRMKGFVEPAAWLSVCTRCNQDVLTDKNAWPLARQLACKMVRDPANYNLRAVCEILDREIEQGEVESWLRTIGNV